MIAALKKSNSAYSSSSRMDSNLPFASVVSEDGIDSKPVSSSGNSSSEVVSSEPELTPTTMATPTTSYDPNLQVSTARDGWSYTPGGSQGVLAKASTLHVTECDRFNGIWQGDTTKKKAYITMDCGYDYNGNTAKILDILKGKNVKITFFVTGAMFETDTLKALVQRMVDEGHLVGNHTWNHPSLPTMMNEKGAAAVNTELDKIESAFFELTGKKIASYMRPPMGEFSEATMQLIQNRGYRSVYWSFAYRDWVTTEQMTYDDALSKTKAGLHNGVVYLLHTVSNTNVEILPALIDEIQAQGYEFGLVNEIK
jgi:peptidoglycan-N-acetylmuramic acid deacetylase